MIYLIGEKCFDEKIGLLSSILWILCPSQSLWNCFVLSEPLYTCLLLLIIYLLVRNNEYNTKSKSLKIGLFIGFLLSLFNMIRPIGIIVIFAIFLWIFIISKNGKIVFKIICLV